MKEVPYSKFIKNCRYICDWIIFDNIFVEFFGLFNLQKYKEKTFNKIKIIKENNYKIIDLYYTDLSENVLLDKFKKYIINNKV
jgi:hypothetical protein